MVTELPYGVGTEKVIERIKTLVQAKKLQGIADVKDLTDREQRPAAGHRGQERLRPRGAPRAALQARRRWRTPSASTPSPWSTASRARSGSRSCSRSSSATASTSYAAARTFRRGKAADRLHLVDGLLIAILDIDEVIQVIRSTDNAAAAKERLIVGLRPQPRSRPTTSSTCRCAG